MSTSYSEIYFSQLFTMLGNISAILISGTVAVPMVSYYSNNKFLDYFSSYYKLDASMKEEKVQKFDNRNVNDNYR